MFKGLDSYNSTLTSNITATETTLPIKALGLGADYSYLEISDGVYSEIVKVTGDFTATRTNGRAFVAGSCVRYRVTTDVVCELIAQGGCAGGGVCTPVSLGATSVPAAVIGTPYTAVFAFNNATSVTAVTKPAWATATVTGSTLILTGTPTTGGDLVIRANGCNNSVVIVNQKIELCEQIGVA
jgi:hypothetical protein